MRRSTHLLLAALACFSLQQHAVAADPGRSIIPQLQERFGLSEAQVRGALGALLVFVRERLPKAEFDEVAKSIPNADYIMREVSLQGIVTGPLDDISGYQESLASLGVGQPLASQFAPAVLEYLAAANNLTDDELARAQSRSWLFTPANRAAGGARAADTARDSRPATHGAAPPRYARPDSCVARHACTTRRSARNCC
jgi:hypothetical protein